MERIVRLPDYTPQGGVRMIWEGDARITVKLGEHTPAIFINANEAGLVSLANLLLFLAQPNVPSGAHAHLDDLNGLEDGSCEIVFGRSE